VAIRVALALTFFHFVGINAARVVLSLYALTLGAHESAVGVLGGMFYLFPLILSWPIGAAADRHGPRGLLLAGGVVGTLALLLPHFFPALPMLYVAAALSGLSLSFFHVTLQNLIGVSSAPEDRPRNFSNFSLVGAVTNFVGPLVAGFSIDHFGHRNACLTVVALAAAALLLILVWGRVLPGPRAGPAPAKTEQSTLLDRHVVTMLATSSLVQLGTDVFQFYIPVYGHDIGLTATAIGIVLASFAAASFVVRAFLARLIKTVGPERLLMYAFAAGALGYVLVPLTHDALMLSAVAFVFGLGMGCGIPLTVILMFSRSTEGRSGQTLGLRLTANNGVRAFGPMVFGAIGSALGVWAVFIVNGLLMASGAVMSYSRKRRSET
jgi:MFS family permease